MKSIRFSTVSYLLLTALLIACVKPGSSAQTGSQTPHHPADPTALPLLSIEALRYKGAFRLPAESYDSSSLNYSEGPIAYHPAKNSLLIVGHAHDQAVAEFGIPPIVDSTDLLELPVADAPLQAFVRLLDRGKNSQNLDRIGGLAVVGKNKLLVNAYEYYDAPGDNTQSMLLVHGADELAGAEVEGFFEVQGGAGHTSGWLSPVPPEWQALLEGSYLTGQSSGIPIIRRTSVGPSAFSFTPEQVIQGQANPVATTTLLDFSLNHPLHSDLDNETGDNKLWTHLSRVVYGFIVPGTRSYLTLGYSGGHESGVCYKCTQNDGNLCGGYCAPDAQDYDTFYWLWDMKELLAAKAGQKNAFDVRPYAYGKFALPFTGDKPELGGGAFDPTTGQLYLTVQKADDTQGEYRNPPVVVVYDVD